jgi:hypothetical protein
MICNRVFLKIGKLSISYATISNAIKKLPYRFRGQFTVGQQYSTNAFILKHISI